MRAPEHPQLVCSQEQRGLVGILHVPPPCVFWVHVHAIKSPCARPGGKEHVTIRQLTATTAHEGPHSELAFYKMLVWPSVWMGGRQAGRLAEDSWAQAPRAPSRHLP